MLTNAPLNIAVIGSGISGLAAAWMLTRQRHRVTVYESATWAGGHSHTVTIPTPDGERAVDTGFIVYNEPAYPNLTALFKHLGVTTVPTSMGFAVSLDNGAYEYSGNDLGGIFGQASNIVSARHWRMLNDTRRFFKAAEAAQNIVGDDLTLGQFLQQNRFGQDFIDRHILPMAAAIWSAPAGEMPGFPAAAFFRFFSNHGLLKLAGRPVWRTVVGGSKVYVEAMRAAFGDGLRIGLGAKSVGWHEGHAVVRDRTGTVETFDHAVIATHADDALRLIDDPSADERRLLGQFRYSENKVVLHTDERLMPTRRRVWSSWNYLGASDKQSPAIITYWMNALQPLDTRQNIFISLNPGDKITAGAELQNFVYHHPVFDRAALAAQRQLWSLQGRNGRWFAGSYFGYGFHEDGLQSGLAVAEEFGSARRPWTVDSPSSRVIALSGRVAAAAGAYAEVR